MDRTDSAISEGERAANSIFFLLRIVVVLVAALALSLVLVVILASNVQLHPRDGKPVVSGFALGLLTGAIVLNGFISTSERSFAYSRTWRLTYGALILMVLSQWLAATHPTSFLLFGIRDLNLVGLASFAAGALTIALALSLSRLVLKKFVADWHQPNLEATIAKKLLRCRKALADPQALAPVADRVRIAGGFSDSAQLILDMGTWIPKSVHPSQRTLLRQNFVAVASKFNELAYWTHNPIETTRADLISEIDKVLSHLANGRWGRIAPDEPVHASEDLLSHYSKVARTVLTALIPPIVIILAPVFGVSQEVIPYGRSVAFGISALTLVRLIDPHYEGNIKALMDIWAARKKLAE